MKIFLSILTALAIVPAYGENFRFGIAERTITPPMMDTYVDENGNKKHDRREPWRDNGG